MDSADGFADGPWARPQLALDEPDQVPHLAAFRAAHPEVITSPGEPPARDPDFSGQMTSELERARRELAISAALAVPGSGAHLMTVRQAQAIDAELAARRQGRREPGGVVSTPDPAPGCDVTQEALMRSEGAPMRTARRGPFDVDEDAALAELELAWADGGYHGFSVGDGTWSAISSAGEVLTGDTPDALTRKIRAHWQAMQ